MQIKNQKNKQNLSNNFIGLLFKTLRCPDSVLRFIEYKIWGTIGGQE